MECSQFYCDYFLDNMALCQKLRCKLRAKTTLKFDGAMFILHGRGLGLRLTA